MAGVLVERRTYVDYGRGLAQQAQYQPEYFGPTALDVACVYDWTELAEGRARIIAETPRKVIVGFGNNSFQHHYVVVGM